MPLFSRAGLGGEDAQAGNEMVHEQMALRRAVYTVLVGGYDALLPPVEIDSGLEYIAFTDAAQQLAPPWQSKPLVSIQRNPRMTARWHKLHPHRILPDCEQSLYLDANILIKARIAPLFDKALGEAPLGLFRHRNRECAYDEAEAVKHLHYDDAAIVDAQMAFYRAHGLPARAGLHFGGIQFRRHNDTKLIELMEDWWRQLKIFSHRDQLSLSFALRRHPVAIALLPGQTSDNAWFAIGPHRKFRVDFAASLPPVDADEVDWLRTCFADASLRGRPGRRPNLADIGESLHRAIKTPQTIGKRIILRIAWRRYIAKKFRGGSDSR